MKIWYGYGSEHSMNLVMIGHFKDIGAAAKAKEAVDELNNRVRQEVADGLIELEGKTDRFSDEVLKILQDVRIHDVAPHELEQFGYDFGVKLDGAKVVLTTDESDVSVFLKIMLNKGARVEVYSAHHYPDTAVQE